VLPAAVVDGVLEVLAAGAVVAEVDPDGVDDGVVTAGWPPRSSIDFSASVDPGGC